MGAAEGPEHVQHIVQFTSWSRIMTLGDHDPVAFRRAAIPDLVFLQLNVRVLCIVRGQKCSCLAVARCLA